ncbi:GerMN domain-containing protein [Cellulosilyticum sp. I15G10I2]|uniref:GerMN domain-containing protein n=1 Tax=Cellulosilyticum sp. I15G10I2 TaxID=1892843 RepID=UPI00085CA715|nr:GerMN domain-containing protein [Cellulosilyticum sp. I15G10I2]
MQWKRVIRIGVIIYTFFLSTIECTTVVAAAQLKTNFSIQSITESYNNLRGINREKSLTKLSVNDKINNTVKLFLGDIRTGEIVCFEYDAKRQNEESDEVYLTKTLKDDKGKPDIYITGIPNDAVIKDIVIDYSKDSVTVNMTGEYNLQGYGSTGEYLALQSLSSTIAHFYNVHTVVLKREGVFYVSGHFSFKENEGIEVSACN